MIMCYLWGGKSAYTLLEIAFFGEFPSLPRESVQIAVSHSVGEVGSTARFAVRGTGWSRAPLDMPPTDACPLLRATWSQGRRGKLYDEMELMWAELPAHTQPKCPAR